MHRSTVRFTLVAAIVPCAATTIAASVPSALPSWVSRTAVTSITEPQAQAAFASMQSAELQLPSDIASGPVRTTYLKTGCAPNPDVPPLLLVHGFDISCLEYRRLMPLLEAAGVEAYAPCIAGWGFTDTTNMYSVGVDAKRAQLLAFHEQLLGGRPALWVGASLGACIAFDCYRAQPSAFARFASLDPGFFTEAPPKVCRRRAVVVAASAAAGCVIASVPLRSLLGMAWMARPRACALVTGLSMDAMRAFGAWVCRYRRLSAACC